MTNNLRVKGISSMVYWCWCMINWSWFVDRGRVINWFWGWMVNWLWGWMVYWFWGWVINWGWSWVIYWFWGCVVSGGWFVDWCMWCCIPFIRNIGNVSSIVIRSILDILQSSIRKQN